MRLRRLTVFALLLAATALPVSAASWLHVRVETDDQEKVNVNVPLALVTTVVPILEQHAPEELTRHGIQIDDHRISVAELREIWQQLRSQGSYELANISGPDANVSVRVEGDYLRIESDEQSKERVEVRVPVRVIDALLEGTGEDLNLLAALDALQAEPEQELVTVTAEDTYVRVWIDESNGS